MTKTGRPPTHVVCTIDGCERAHDARGWCRSHYQRWKRTGNPVAPVRKYEPKTALLPAAPLSNALRRRMRSESALSICRELDIDNRYFYSLLNQKFVQIGTADRLAIALGYHPSELWPDEWAVA